MKSVDKVISIIKEMMVANPPGVSGGFGSASSSEGSTSGFDPLIQFKKNSKVDFRRVPKNYKKWVKSLNTKNV